MRPDILNKLLSSTDNNGKKLLTLKNDFYVNSEFTGENSNYCLANNMLYQKFQAYLCQERGEETEDLALL